jgi:hypothetical protein
VLTACLLDVVSRVTRFASTARCGVLYNQGRPRTISAQPWDGTRETAQFGGTGRRMRNGGADRDRTDDPLLAKQMLSQLSYSPGDPGGFED